MFSILNMIIKGGKMITDNNHAIINLDHDHNHNNNTVHSSAGL